MCFIGAGHFVFAGVLYTNITKYMYTTNPAPLLLQSLLNKQPVPSTYSCLISISAHSHQTEAKSSTCLYSTFTALSNISLAWKERSI